MHYLYYQNELSTAVAVDIPITAPVGFMKEVASENTLLGNAMSRRALYRYCSMLGFVFNGRVSVGIGQNIGSGTVSLIRRTHDISSTPTNMSIDGIGFIFQHTPKHHVS